MIKGITLRTVAALWLVLATWALQAQVTVKGKVTDDAHEPLIGVNILVKNSTAGTVSELDGTFELTVPNPYVTLVFTYVGYSGQEVALKGQTTIDVTMSYGSQLLNEVVVVGYGTQRKSDVTGSVASVKSEDIQKIATSSVTQALQGKVAGVQVTASSGRPGDGAVVRVRGVGTFNGTAPIYVVDGVILDNMDFLNPSDIESIEVLKDASAAAIYGTRGANGVIMVTTKKGRQSDKTHFSLNSYVGRQQVAQKIDLVNAREYAQLSNEAAMNTGTPKPFADPDALGEGTDWQDIIFRDAMIQNYNLSANGGNDKILFNLSADVFRQEGIVRSSYFNRYSFRANNEYRLTKDVKVGHNLMYQFTDNNNEPGGILFTAYTADPTVVARDSAGNFGNTSNRSNVSNPAAQLEYNEYNRGYAQQLIGNVFGEVYILRNFTFRSTFNFSMGNSRGKSFTPEFFVNDKQFNPESILSVSLNRSRDWQWENTLTYTKAWDLHRVTVLGGVTSQARDFENWGGSRRRLVGDAEEFYYLNAGDIETQTNFNGASQEKYYSYLFRLNYALKDRYLLTASFRRDGSSKFGSERRFGNFMSVAAAWRVIEESFMRNQDFFTNLKLRLSWGVLGNDKIPYTAAIPTVTGNLNAVFGTTEDLLFGATPTRLANSFLQWEESKTTDIGIDIGVLNNRLTLEVDRYIRKTFEILLPVPIPDYVGSEGDPYVNAANLENRGWELTINWRDRLGKVAYNIGGIGSYNQNEVLSLGTGNEAIIAGGVSGGGFSTRSEVGIPIGSFYGYQVEGIYQNQADLDNFPKRGDEKPGDLRFADTNGDGVISTDDRVFIGNALPDYIYGFNAGIEFAGLDLSVDFNGVYGNELYNAKKMDRFFGVTNFETSFLDRWNGENTSNTEPRVTNGGYPNYAVSERFIEDGSFLRLRSVMLGYTLPESLIGKIKMERLRIYFSATNPLTWSTYSGYSPEVTSESAIDNGIDRGIYPVAKVFTFGLQAGF